MGQFDKRSALTIKKKSYCITGLIMLSPRIHVNHVKSELCASQMEAGLSSHSLIHIPRRICNLQNISGI